jgi:hypothetical protein
MVVEAALDITVLGVVEAVEDSLVPLVAKAVKVVMVL